MLDLDSKLTLECKFLCGCFPRYFALEIVLWSLLWAPWILIWFFLWILLSMCVCWCIKVHEVLIIIYCSRANHPSFVSRMLIKNMCSNDVSYFRNVKCSDAKQNSNQFYLSLFCSLLLLLCLYKRLHPAIKPLAFTPISSNIKRKIIDNTLLPSENLLKFSLQG